MSILAGIPILVFLLHNKDSKKVERFFYHHDHQMYMLLQISLFVLIMAFIINTRWIAMQIMNAISNNIMTYSKRHLPFR